MGPWVGAIAIAAIGIVVGWLATIAKRGTKSLVADVVREEHAGHEHVDLEPLEELVRESIEVLRIEMQTGFARIESLERKVENGLTHRTRKLEEGQSSLHNKVDAACERLARIEGLLDRR